MEYSFYTALWQARARTNNKKKVEGVNVFKTIMSNFHIEKIFWIIKKKLKYMILSGLLCAILIGVYGYFTQVSLYRADITFYVYSNIEYVSDSGANLNTSEVTQAKTLLDSYMQIIKSKSFLNSVIEELGIDYTATELRKMISSTSVNNTAVFSVSVYDQEAVMAANIANMIGKLAPEKVINIVKSGGIEVLDPAEIPVTPYQETSVLKYTVIGFGVGFIAVMLIALLRGLMNTTVRRKYEIEDLFTIPILGDVPQLNGKKKEKVNLILDQESPFAYKEAYSNIRANLLFTAKGEKCPVYAITSADQNEGKSINAINLAVSYANLGKKVLLLDADMRNSSIAEKLGIDRRDGKGLSQFLAGITDDLERHHYMENLDIVLSGDVPPNPSELLVGKRWKAFMEKCKEEYDAVFIDLPPIGIVSDALFIVEDIVAYILVVRENITKFNREELIVSKIEPIGGNICGFIYNGISQKSPDYRYRDISRYGKDGYGKEYAN